MAASEINLHDILLSTVFFLIATCICVPLSKRAGLGSVLGYLIAGVLVGPFCLKLFVNPEALIHFAEIGVVFLLFIIGLELNLTKLWSMRREVFGMGTLQVGVTAVLLGTALHYICFFGELSLSLSLFIGATLALSSTAFAVQLLQEKGDLHTRYGQSAVSVLLFQDLAAIPLLAIAPMLALKDGEASQLNYFAVAKAVAVILGVIYIGRLLFRHLLRLIAVSRTKEVFTAASLLMVIGVSLLMESVGLSMSLGAFLAGVILADSEYRHELETDIEPFKGLLLGLFFMAVGMSINLSILTERPMFILLLTVGLMLIKFVSLFVVAKLMKEESTNSKNLALLLAQSGEFGFVILSLASDQKIIGVSLEDTLTLAISFSMALTPIAILISDRFANNLSVPQKPDYDANFDLTHPKVIIAGFGRYGQVISRVLMMQKIPFTALEHDPDHVNAARKFGFKIFFGDALRLDLLRSAGVENAKIFIIAIDDVESSVELARLLREEYPDLVIYARARNRQHVFDLMKLDVQVIHRETFASSLEMSKDVLTGLHYSEDRSNLIISTFRKHDEDFLKEQFEIFDDDKLFLNRTREMNIQLQQLFVADTERK